MLSLSDVQVIDLSIGIEPGVPSEPWPPKVESLDHSEGATILAENLRATGTENVTAEDFPDEMGLAWETVQAITHTGTHLDAPWHYGPAVGDSPAKTIEEIPIEWCCGDAVVLDFTWKEAGTEITPEDLDAQLEALDHTLSAGEIVLIHTGSDELWGDPEYLMEFPGMSAPATKHLTRQGVRVIGTDAYGFDKPFTDMGQRYAETGDSEELWPAHLAGREVEYCQIEKMANLDSLPRQTNVPLVTTPVVIEGASAGWVRPVALFEEGP
ncbi:cyclase family protein [Halocatena halophila]|uniref:cyclase family protein n=1 Tax=Halocatena halophila TaxID=2814576 RepID=UPI002ED18B0B